MAIAGVLVMAGCPAPNDPAGGGTTLQAGDKETVSAGSKTYISWYGAVMICNWLTEMRDGNTDNVVYTDFSSEDRTKTGFRLPVEWECEYAARYRGNNSTNIVEDNEGNPLYTNPYFTKGNSVSGATADYNDADACKEMAWYSANAGGNPHPVGGKTANTLGLHDMSGGSGALMIMMIAGLAV